MRYIIIFIAMTILMSCSNLSNPTDNGISNTTDNSDSSSTDNLDTVGTDDKILQPAPLKWVTEIGGLLMSSPTIGEDGIIYIGGQDYDLFAINPDGSFNWHIPIGNSDLLYDDYGEPVLVAVFSSPAIAEDGTVYICSLDNNLYAINPDGTVKWTFSPAGVGRSSPAIGADGTIYIGFDNLYAINPDGTLKWSYAPDTYINTSPSVGPDGTIYFFTQDDYLNAISTDGILKWKFQIATTFYEVEPYAAIGSDGTIYIGSPYENKLYAINNDGTFRWTFTINTFIESSPSIGEDGTIFACSVDGDLYAINSDGNLKWIYSSGEDYHIEDTPAIGSDGTIYFGASKYNHSDIIALNPGGTLKWIYSIQDYPNTFSSPAIAEDGTMYIGLSDGKLYAFQTESYGLANSPWPMFGHDARHTGRAD